MIQISPFEDKNTNFVQVNNVGDLCESLHLRYKIYCTEKGFNVKNNLSLEFTEMLTKYKLNNPYGNEYEFDNHDHIDSYFKGNKRPVAHFIARKNNETIGTIRIISDSDVGLPMEPDYKLDKFRTNGDSIAEVSRLMTRHPSALRGLFRCVIQYADKSNVDYIFATSLEKAVPFYRKICLSPIDKPFEYKKLGGLWVPLMMDLKTVLSIAHKTVKYMSQPE